ncbi:MAG: hypothetical protein J3K34DRAFT_500619 [Monoraphidium minutum]|nr:MAG: hypothetical protein J3K34DRAFT_500619 [Monoraphidium minutum]
MLTVVRSARPGLVTSRAPARRPQAASHVPKRPCRAQTRRPGAMGSDEPGGGERDEPAAGPLGNTYDEELVADVAGYDEEEPGMTSPIRAALRAGGASAVKGGMPRPGAARGDGLPPPAEPAEGPAAAAAGAAGASGGYGGGEGGGGGETMAERVVEGGPAAGVGVEMVTGGDEVSRPEDVPPQMRDLAQDVLRQGLTDE